MLQPSAYIHLNDMLIKFRGLVSCELVLIKGKQSK